MSQFIFTHTPPSSNEACVQTKLSYQGHLSAAAQPISRSRDGPVSRAIVVSRHPLSALSSCNFPHGLTDCHETRSRCYYDIIAIQTPKISVAEGGEEA